MILPLEPVCNALPSRRKIVNNKMTFEITTLGCKVNSCESAAIEKLMLERGFENAADNQAADIYIINSCAVTGTSVEKARHLAESFKKKYPDCVIALCGCFPQSFPEKAALNTAADIVTGNSQKSKIPEMIEEFLKNKTKIVKIEQLSREYDKNSAVPDENRTRAFIKIEDGCDRFCSYCIIPTARGRVRSLPAEEIEKQAAECVSSGHKELVLTGINLGCYGQELGLSLVDAVEAAAKSGVPRLRLSSLEPEMLSDSIIERFKAIPALCPHFHLSLQSGSDSVLKKMNRKYTTEQYAHVVEKLRRAFPNCAITTDIIAGFPMETDEDFQQTLAFAKEMGFAKIHVFPYSVRNGTVAAEMPQLHPRIINERTKLLIAESDKIEHFFLKKQVDTTQTVLIEKPKSSSYSQGFTERYVPVRIMGENIPRHTLVKVKITGVREKYCVGKVCG